MYALRPSSAVSTSNPDKSTFEVIISRLENLVLEITSSIFLLHSRLDK